MQNLFNVNTLIVHMLMYACVSIWNFVLFFWYLTYILVVDFFDNAENFVICTMVDYRFHAAILSFFLFSFCRENFILEFDTDNCFKQNI